MRELALHLLDIAENSVSGKATKIEISVNEDLINDCLKMQVKDNGIGMDAAMVAKVTDPFVTTRTTRKVGLGIPLLKEAAEFCNGGLTIKSTPGVGTEIEVAFQRSHIDRMPLGDLASTILSEIVAYPHIHWIFRYQVSEKEFVFDNQPIMEELGDIPITEPSILAYVRELIEEGINNLKESTSFNVTY